MILPVDDESNTKVQEVSILVAHALRQGNSSLAAFGMLVIIPRFSSSGVAPHFLPY